LRLSLLEDDAAARSAFVGAAAAAVPPSAPRALRRRGGAPVTRIWLLVLGAFATVTFASIVLVVVPRLMLVSVPVPDALRALTLDEVERASLVDEGRRIYLREGC